MSKEKDAGTTFEREVAEYLRTRGFGVRRLALAGKHDQGDLELRRKYGLNAPMAGQRWSIECKYRRDAKSSLNLGGWLDEAQRERRNYAEDWALNEGFSPDATLAATHSLLIVKRVRKGAHGAFVIQSLEDWCDEKGAQ